MEGGAEQAEKVSPTEHASAGPFPPTTTEYGHVQLTCSSALRCTGDSMP